MHRDFYPDLNPVNSVSSYLLTSSFLFSSSLLTSGIKHVALRLEVKFRPSLVKPFSYIP